MTFHDKLYECFDTGTSGRWFIYFLVYIPSVLVLTHSCLWFYPRFWNGAPIIPLTFSTCKQPSKI
jgi:hypothetical protein